MGRSFIVTTICIFKFCSSLFSEMTEPNRFQYSGFYHQSSASESNPQPFSMYGHYFSATYFTAILPNHHVTQHIVTAYPHYGQSRDVHSSEKIKDSVHQCSVSYPSNSSNHVEENRPNETGSSTARRRNQCSVSNMSPISQLYLPTIKTSDNVAENVMMEEADLGYGSWSDNTVLESLTSLDEFDLSAGSDSVFDDVHSNFSDIIDEVISDVAITSDVSTQEPAAQEKIPRTKSYLQKYTIPTGHEPVSNHHLFKNSALLQTHRDATTEQFLQRVQERKQASKQPLRCSLCNKHFTNKTNLQVHLRMHSNLRPHRCLYCEKSFTQKSTLRTHMRIHTGEKPFVCSHCARAFSDYSTYRKHQRIHSGEKPYTCDVCSKAFSQSGNMIRHRQTHIKNNGEILV